MTNETGDSLRHRIQTSLVVFPLLALLFVFVSSLTHHQASSTRLDHGFTVALDHLVVAGQSEALRAHARADDTKIAGEHSPDDSHWWAQSPTDLWPSLNGATALLPADAGRGPLTPRFLVPLLRAPPLA